MKRIKFLFATTLTMVVLNGFVHGQDTTLTVTSAGKVGIGTTTPTYKLEIEGGATPLRITGGGSQFQKFLFDVATGGFAIFRMYDKDVNEDFRFATNGNSWLDGDGNVGIGTTGPVAKLHLVNGSAGFTPSTATELAIESSGNTLIQLMSPANGAGVISFGSPTESDRGFITYDHANDAMILGSGGGTKMIIDDNGDVRMTRNLDITGNVGIGTTSPGAKLEVAGQVKITGGTPGAGKVLTSDAAGLATWQTATGGGDASYGSSGASPNNAVFVSDNGNVGMGTTGPLSRLHIEDTNETFGNFQNLFIRTSSPSGPNIGGGIGFGGKFSSAGGTTGFAAIAGRKENSIDGNAAGYLGFATNDGMGAIIEKVRITSAGNVGIGTTNPGKPLDINGSARASSFIGRLNASNMNYGYVPVFRANIAPDLDALSNSTIFVGNTGDVGIGTTSPTAKLHIGGSAGVDGIKFPDGTLQTTAAPGGSGLWSASGSDIFYNSGNVGIGTTSPATKLDVNGAITLSPSGAVAGPSLVNSVDGVLVTGGATSGIRFNNQDNTLELMRITNAGNAGIGTTSPAAKLEVAGFPPLTNDPVAIRITNLRSSLGLFWELRAYDSGAGGPFGRFSVFGGISGGADKLVITTTGNVGIGTIAPTNPLEMASGAHVTAGGVWTDASSRQYKENISNLTPEEAIAALEKLNPVKFNYKVEKDEEYVGFIAEDAPDLVATKDRQSLSPMDIVAVLTKVVQQQQKKIAELEARINASQ
jgi:hypothetical protein